MNPDELTKKIFFYLDEGYDVDDVADFLGITIKQVKDLISKEENR